ncbi:ABC transporter permease [Acuticoccus sp. M5D2P5]|uniref:ABC transporter permease n=1 Tax=Acuticoccus kalidii TaxID=2910977 RepID=UPI001F1E5853|nr:ABC transporter permease [Acuticoccus kalidii]MCF3935702.1 ABC transporter permease [Acuticoccus kalidii]
MILFLVNAIIVLFLAAPILVVMATAFTTTGYPVFPPEGFTLKWFARVFETGEFTDAAQLSALLAICATAIACTLGTLTALGLSRWKGRGQSALSAFVLSPILFPTIVLGLALLVFYSRIGLQGSFLGLVIGHSIITTPFVVRLVMASLSEFDPAVEEAARNLGAGWWRTFFQVTLPLIRPGVLAGGVFAFILSFDELVVTLFLAAPGMSTLPMRIFTFVQYSSEPTISAIATMLIVVWALIGVPLYARFLSIRHK